MTIGTPIRSRILVLIAGAAIAIGCSKSSKKAGSGAKGASPAAKAAFKYLPKDADTLIGVTGVPKGAVGDLVKGQANNMLPPAFRAVKEKCGIDVLADLETLVVAAGEDQKDLTKQYAVVRGKFTKKQMNDCVNKSEIDGKKLSAKDEGKLTAYSREGEDGSLYGFWPDDHTLVVGLAPNNKAGVEALMNQKQSVADNAALMKLVGDVNGQANVWAVGAVEIKRLPVAKPKATLAEVYFDDGFKLNLRLRYGDSAAAGTAKDGVNSAVAKIKKSPFGGLLSPFLEDLDVSTNGNDAVLVLKLDEKRIKRLMGFAKSFGGMGR